MSRRVAFIGGGNMGRAIVGGLVQRGYAPDLITVAEPQAGAREGLARDFGVRVTSGGVEAVGAAEVVVLAVKPQQMKSVLEPLATALKEPLPVILSVAAGITTAALQRWLGGTPAIVRAMPNTPALIGRGATALFATPQTSPAARGFVAELLAATGLVVWVEDESQLDAVTALSGSGPAYFFLLLECLEQSGVRLGLPAALARQLAIETAAGAAELARTSPLDPASLRVQVTSRGGTTERALETFAAGGFADLVEQALRAAAARSAELGRELGAS